MLQHIMDDDQDNVADEEGDTVQSLDFTGELKKLKETGGFDGQSFVEQLESAFCTPTQLKLNFKVGGGRASVADRLPLSRLPFALVKEEMKDGALSMNSPGFNSRIEQKLLRLKLRAPIRKVDPSLLCAALNLEH